MKKEYIWILAALAALYAYSSYNQSGSVMPQLSNN